MAQEWVVYVKHRLNHTDSVIDHLARYTHRIAITNARILSVNENNMSLRYQDYADHNRSKTLHLEGKEFIRRYLLHVLPKGFTQVRHYGFLASFLPRTAFGTDPRGAGRGASAQRRCAHTC